MGTLWNIPQKIFCKVPIVHWATGSREVGGEGVKEEGIYIYIYIYIYIIYIIVIHLLMTPASQVCLVNVATTVPLLIVMPIVGCGAVRIGPIPFLSRRS